MLCVPHHTINFPSTELAHQDMLSPRGNTFNVNNPNVAFMNVSTVLCRLMYHLCPIAMILKYRSGTVEFTQTLSQAVFAPAIRNARRATLITRQE